LKRVIIFGNSGSGKTTLARKLADNAKLAHLDLDTLAWQATSPPTRKPLDESRQSIEQFINANDNWVIEGCYADLLSITVPFCNEMIWLDLPIETCVANAKLRPWEPHKYSSKAAQDKNLPMLIDWIRQYTEREDTFSREAHLALFEGYGGDKLLIGNNK
jgi:adenylate kinase family enzyme